MSGETERLLLQIGDSVGITIPPDWLKKMGLKRGCKIRLILNDKILIDVPRTEAELHAEIEKYEKTLKETKKD